MAGHRCTPAFGWQGGVVRAEGLVVCPHVPGLAQFGGEALLSAREHTFEVVALLGDRAKLYLHVMLGQRAR